MPRVGSKGWASLGPLEGLLLLHSCPSYLSWFEHETLALGRYEWSVGVAGLTVCGEGNYVWGSQGEQGRSPHTLTLPILIEAEMEALGGFEGGRAMPEARKSPKGVPPTSASAADLRTPSLVGVSFDLNPTDSQHFLPSTVWIQLSAVPFLQSSLAPFSLLSGPWVPNAPFSLKCHGCHGEKVH